MQNEKKRLNCANLLAIVGVFIHQVEDQNDIFSLEDYISSVNRMVELKNQLKAYESELLFTLEEMEHMKENRVIPAIRLVRERKNLGLAEAKSLVEQFMAERGWGKFKPDTNKTYIQVDRKHLEQVAVVVRRLESGLTIHGDSRTDLPPVPSSPKEVKMFCEDCRKEEWVAIFREHNVKCYCTDGTNGRLMKRVFPNG